MKILNKKEVEQILGKYGIWSGNAGNAMISQVKYLGGILSFDKLIKEDKIDLKTSSGTSFEVRPKGLEIYIINGFSKFRIGVEHDNINYWSFEKQEEITQKKSKSIVGRALLGGLLLGPVGAIVGGMTGIGDKGVTESLTGIDNILSISCNDSDDKEHIFLFNCTNKKAKKVFGFFQENYTDLYKEEVGDEKKGESQKVGTSIADELIKLKSLLDAGVLTPEEFEEQKSKLLNR